MDIDSPPACRRLPPEILLKIFVFLRGHTVPVSTRHDHADCMYPIVVTQVCREWRMVAFACEQLWTCEALCHGREWTMRALELSGTSPLSVYVFPSSDKDKKGHHFEKTMEGATLLLGQLHRIEFLSVDLTLSGISESERGIITSLLCAQTAPRMKTLVLDYGYREWIEELPQDPELFAGITPPHLEELTIYLAIIPPTFHLFNAPLTCLILESCTIWRAMDPFLDTLSRLPTLETFSYIMDPVDRIGIESNTVSQARAARSVVMPNMRRFKLGDNIVSVGNIMPYLSLPSNASVTIMGACEDQPLYPQSPSIEQSSFRECFMPWLPDAFPADCVFDTISIHDSMGAVFTAPLVLVASNPVFLKRPECDVRPIPPPRFEFKPIEVPKNQYPKVMAMLHFFLRLPIFQYPKKISVVQCSFFLQESDWNTLAPIFTRLDTLEVGDAAAYGYVRALAAATTGALLPRTTLIFAFVNFHELCGCPNRDGNWCMASNAIRQALGYLSNLGYPTPRVVLKECRITAEEVRVLKYTLAFMQADVEWDGVCNGERELRVRREFGIVPRSAT